jgi:hypothetical protein
VNAVNRHVVFANTVRNLDVERRRYLSTPIAKPLLLVNSSPDCPRLKNGHSQNDHSHPSHYSSSQRIEQPELDLARTQSKGKLETSEKDIAEKSIEEKLSPVLRLILEKMRRKGKAGRRKEKAGRNGRKVQ